VSSDPQRLFEAGSEAPEELRELLRRGRQDLPGRAELGRLEAKLLPIFAAPAGAAPAPSAGSEVAAASSGAKLAAGALVVAALIGGGAYVALRGSSHPSSPLPVQPKESTSQPELQPQPLAPTAAPAAPAVNEPAAPVEPSEPRPARTAPSAAGPNEVQLLEQARTALGSDPGRALALAQEHKRRFPKGALAQEREVIAIEALARLGDSDQARKRAKEFEDHYPNSAHRRKVGSSTPGK